MKSMWLTKMQVLHGSRLKYFSHACRLFGLTLNALTLIIFFSAFDETLTRLYTKFTEWGLTMTSIYFMITTFSTLSGT